MKKSIVFTGCLLIFSFFSALIPTRIPAAEPGSFFPQYYRTIIINAQDYYGQPLTGVRAAILPRWGRLATEGDLVSGMDGKIRFLMEPVVEDLLAGLYIRDRFHLYRLDFQYRLRKEDRVLRVGRIQDDQEEIRYFNSAYHGLNRSPDESPIEVDVRIPAYRIFLASGQEQTDLVESIIAGVMNNEEDFELAEESLSLPRTGGLEAGLEFKPIFDPSEYGLGAAAVELLKGPVHAFFQILSTVRRPFEGPYRLRVGARFQYRTHPYSPTVRKEFIFIYSPDDLDRLVRRADAPMFDAAGPAIIADGVKLVISDLLGEPR